MLGTNIADAARQHRAALDAELRRARARLRSRACRGGIKVFAGQRDDPFFVDLGSIFDLAGLRPFNPFHLIPLPAAPGVDALDELQHALDRDPGADLASSSRLPNTTVGIYASASRQKERSSSDDGTKRRPRARGSRSRASATR